MYYFIVIFILFYCDEIIKLKKWCSSGAKKLFLAPLKSYLELQQWSYSQKIAVYYSSKVKKKLFYVHIAGLNIRGVFFSGMYYYIIIDILFYCDVYIILLY